MIYLDSCALVKLLRSEDYSADIATHVSSATTALISSELARTEVHRALWRNQEPQSVHETADTLLTHIATLPLAAIIDDASRLPQQHLRSLDALHLATALRLGDAVHQFITYDQRLAQAAHESNLKVLSPGAD